MEYVVFIDAEVVRHKQLDFRGKVFETLEDLVKDGSVRVLITSVVQREVLRWLEGSSRDVATAHQKFAKRAYVLNGLGKENSPYLKKMDETSLKASLKAAWEAFLKRFNVTEIPIHDVDVDAVFNDYFAVKPPFAEGKKSKEFPDAFSIAALRKWCLSNNAEVYVVSGDKDLESSCGGDSKLHYCESLEKFLHATNVVQEKKKTEYVRKQLLAAKEKIKVAIEEQFPERYFILMDQEGDVEDVEVTKIEISDEPDVIGVGDEDALVHLTAEVSFTGVAGYPDFDTATYDSEDKEYIFHHHKKHQVDGSQEVVVEIDVSYAKEGFGELSLDEIAVVEPNDVEVYAGYTEEELTFG